MQEPHPGPVGSRQAWRRVLRARLVNASQAWRRVLHPALAGSQHGPACDCPSTWAASTASQPANLGYSAAPQWPKSCGHVRNKRVVDREEAVQRIRAACDAR